MQSLPAPKFKTQICKYFLEAGALVPSKHPAPRQVLGSWQSNWPWVGCVPQGWLRSLVETRFGCAHARPHTHTHTHTHTRTHAHAPTRTRAHTPTRPNAQAPKGFSLPGRARPRGELLQGGRVQLCPRSRAAASPRARRRPTLGGLTFRFGLDLAKAKSCFFVWPIHSGSEWGNDGFPLVPLEKTTFSEGWTPENCGVPLVSL